ncbi:MAG: cobalt ECF transporter T component CbiQ [Marinifilaceae bacterium]
MSKLEDAFNELTLMERMSAKRTSLRPIDIRARIIVTIVYLVCMLSLPLIDIGDILLFLVFPILTCSWSGIPFSYVIKRSLIVLPFVLFIGIFNPIFDHRPGLVIGNITLSVGWLTFIAIVVRGILSVLVSLLLIMSSGFHTLCRGLERMRIPSIFTTQLLFVYRYIFVLIQEAIAMSRARDSRSFGKKGYSLKMWGTLTGQLMIRTFERAERIHNAMLARGFTGSFRGAIHTQWHTRDTVYLIVWSLLFILVRWYEPMVKFGHYWG